MPTDEWEPWPCVDDEDGEELGPLGEDDPDEWRSEADEPGDEDEPEHWDPDVAA